MDYLFQYVIVPTIAGAIGGLIVSFLMDTNNE
jgi:hypothetical protein